MNGKSDPAVPSSEDAQSRDERQRLDLAELYAAHSGFVHRTCRQLGVPMSSAEDMVHDVFIVAYRRSADFAGRGSVRSWLYGITRRVVMHYHRRELRSARRMRLVAEPPPTPDPEQTLQQQQRGKQVEKILLEVDPLKREVLYLADAEGFSAREIADALEVNVNTIYARLRAGRRVFARLLAREQRRWARRTS